MNAQTSGDVDVLRRLLDRPTLAPLADGVRITLGATRNGAYGPAPFLVPEPDCLIVSAAMLWYETAGVHLRHGLELSWLLGQDLPPPVIGLLAARTAALFLELESPAMRALCRADPAFATLTGLAGPCPEAARLAAAWRLLADFQSAPASRLEPWMAGRVRDCWDLAGPVEHLLLTGGDTRLELDRRTGLNRYGCAPRPRPGVVGFASCTASSISEAGYGAAEACRRRVLSRAFGGPPAAALAREAEAIRGAILDHYGAADLAEAILAPSGTDATLLAMALLTARAREARVTSILVAPAETGSGVPAAAAGRHFGERTATGLSVAKGAAIADFPADMPIASVPLRDVDGTPFRADATDRAFATAAAAATGQGRAVLHLVDGSKTGLLAPSYGLAASLWARHDAALDVLVDAAQARTSPERVRHSLAVGWPVLLTGSKFFGGPPFSGVVLLPRARFGRLLEELAPTVGLADYISAHPGSGAERLLGLGGNFGLALRWTAALAEMMTFAALPPGGVAELVARLGVGLARLIAGDRRFRLLPGPRPVAAGWSGRPTIFTFMVRDPLDPRRWLSPAALGSICALMNADAAENATAPRWSSGRAHHIGQPVLIGAGPEGPIGALRLALGARNLHAAAVRTGEPAGAGTMEELAACIGKLARIQAQLPERARSLA